MEPFIGEIRLFAGDFAPRGWFFCQGQLLDVHRYQQLHSLLQTYYGGDGMQNFALPDLRGRVAIQPGRGTGLDSAYELGQRFGTESKTLTEKEMPSHSHGLMCTGAASNAPLPSGNVISVLIDKTAQLPVSLYNDLTDTATELSAMHVKSIGTTGASQPFSLSQPALAINYIIAYEGIFPSRG